MLLDYYNFKKSTENVEVAKKKLNKIMTIARCVKNASQFQLISLYFFRLPISVNLSAIKSYCFNLAFHCIFKLIKRISNKTSTGN